MIFFWTMLYGLAYTLPRMYARNAWATSISMSIYILLLILWLIRTGKAGYIRLQGLQSWNLPDFLPLLLLPVCNLPLVTSPPPTVVLLMVCVSVAEEILFRGVLLRFFQKRGNFQSILITAVIFALFHGVNLICSDSLIPVLLQILCAAGVGFLYGAITLNSKEPLGNQIVMMLDVAARGFGSTWNDVIIPEFDYVLVEKTLGKFGNRVEVFNDLPIRLQHLVGSGY